MILSYIFAIVTIIITSGCAIYYRDASTGAEHIWGIGHLSVKVTQPYDEKQTVISRATMTGLSLGLDDGSFFLSAGWDQRERILVYNENTSIAIERPPNNDFFLLRISSTPTETTPLFDLNSKERKDNKP